MEGAAVKLREASRHLCTDLIGHPGPQLSDCVLGVGSPVQNKSVVELPSGQPGSSQENQRKPLSCSPSIIFWKEISGNNSFACALGL